MLETQGAFSRASGENMSGFEHFRTQDPEQARHWATGVFCDADLRLAKGRKMLNASMSHRMLNGLGVVRITYGAPLTIAPGRLDTFYIIQVPLRGMENIRYGGVTTRITPCVGSVLNPHRSVEIDHDEGTEKICLRIDRDLLERHCRQHLGQTPNHRIEFDTALPLETLPGRRLKHTINWLFSLLQTDPGVLPPLLAAHIEQVVATMLLTSQRNNYTDSFNRDAKMLAPAFVKRSEQFIEERAHEPITTGDIAEYVGVSTRSLFAGFRKYRNVSPMRYLKEVRLDRVREQLRQGRTRETTVTSVAYQWGFYHLGHFTTDYKRRFGEPPSETLMR